MKAKNCIYKLGPFEPNFQNHYIPPYDCFLFISQTDQNEIAIFTNFFMASYQRSKFSFEVVHNREGMDGNFD